MALEKKVEASAPSKGNPSCDKEGLLRYDEGIDSVSFVRHCMKFKMNRLIINHVRIKKCYLKMLVISDSAI